MLFNVLKSSFSLSFNNDVLLKEDIRKQPQQYDIDQEEQINLKHIEVMAESAINTAMQTSDTNPNKPHAKRADGIIHNRQFDLYPILLEKANNDEYFELKSASANTPVNSQAPLDSLMNNNRIKLKTVSNQDSKQRGLLITKNMSEYKSDFEFTSIDMKKLEQIKISRDRQSVDFSYIDEKLVSNQSITLEQENMDSGIRVSDEDEKKHQSISMPPESQSKLQMVPLLPPVVESQQPPSVQVQFFGGFGGGGPTSNNHGYSLGNQFTSNTAKGRLLPKRTGMFGRQPTVMRNSEGEDMHMFGSGIRSQNGNVDSRLSQNKQKQQNSKGELISPGQDGQNSSGLRFSTKNANSDSIDSKTNNQSNRLKKNRAEDLGQNNYNNESLVIKNEGFIDNGSSRNNQRGGNNPNSSRNAIRENLSNMNREDDNTSFSSQEIGDSRRELCLPTDDHDNDFKNKSKFYSQKINHQQQKSQQSLQQDQKSVNQRHQMIVNPKKLQIQTKKEGFSAHREAFLKNAAMTVETKVNNIKKSTSMTSKHNLFKHQNSTGGAGVGNEFQRQQSKNSRIKQMTSLRPNALNENKNQMPGMLPEPPSPLGVKKQITGRKFFDMMGNKSPLTVKPENDVSIEESAELSPFPVIPEETPTQRLVRALRVARQIKEQKEKEEMLKLENQSAILSDDSKLSTIRSCAKRFSKWITDQETWIIYPEDRFKAIWDMIILVFVIMTCIYAPISLAFNDPDQASHYLVLDWIINVFFIGDIFVNCITAYYDNEFSIVRNHRMIIKRYLMTRFIIDLIAVIPFDSFINSDNQKSGLQFLQLSRLNRLKRLTRMFQLVKMLQVHNNYIKKLKSFLNIDSSSSRFVFLMINLVLLQHVVACIWIFFAKFDATSKINWIFDGGYNDIEEFELYVTSYYFTVTTIMTVGYGDIVAQSLGEKLLAILLMLIGVVAFSFATGSISSIIANADTAEDKLRAKMEILKELNVEYGIDQTLYNKVVKALQYGYAQTTQSYSKLLDDLPVKLKVELSMAIHQKIYSGINFFKEKEKNFIAWVGPLLRPMHAQQNDYIYKETEHITEMYFLSKGKAGYVLPRYSNCIYIEIEQGQHFGHLELANNKSFFKEEKSFKKSLNKHKDTIKRSFTIRALITCDLLTLSMDDLDLMKVEFHDVYFELIKDARETLLQYLNIKKQEIQKREIEKTKQKSNLNSKLSGMILSNLQKSLHDNVESPKQRLQLKDRLWTAAQRSLRLQRLTKTQVWDSSQMPPISPIEKGRAIRNIFMKAAALAAEQNKEQNQSYDDIRSNYGRSKSNVSYIGGRQISDNNVVRSSTFKHGIQTLTPTNRPERQPITGLINGGFLTPRPLHSAINVTTYNSQRTVVQQETPTLNGPQPYQAQNIMRQASSISNNIMMNYKQNINGAPQTPASQHDLMKMATANQLSNNTSDSSNYSTDPNKKEIHEMKTMISRLNFKMDSVETMLTEMRDEQGRMYEMLSNHIMLQQTHSSEMKTDSFENNQDEQNEQNQDDQIQEEQQNSQINNQNEEHKDKNRLVNHRQVNIVINEASELSQSLQSTKKNLDNQTMPIASFDDVSALMYQQQLKESRIKDKKTSPPKSSEKEAQNNN